MKIEFVKLQPGDPWVSIDVNGGEFVVSAKLFDESSELGINNGRVSKLTITEAAKAKEITNGLNVADWFAGVIVNYDRGWDIIPQPEHKKMYKAVLKLLESAPKHLS